MAGKKSLFLRKKTDLFFFFLLSFFQSSEETGTEEMNMAVPCAMKEKEMVRHSGQIPHRFSPCS